MEVNYSGGMKRAARECRGRAPGRTEYRMGNITALRRRRSGSFSGVRSRNVTSAGPGRSSSLSSAMATVPTTLGTSAVADFENSFVALFADMSKVEDRTTFTEADTHARAGGCRLAPRRDCGLDVYGRPRRAGARVVSRRAL